MKKVYRFQSDGNLKYPNAISQQIPSLIIVLSLWFAFLIIHTIIICNEKHMPIGIPIASLILFLIMTIVLFVFLFRFFFLSYNNSITETHWDFNQEITIDGNRIVSKLTFGEDTFEEELILKKVIKKKKVTIYYQDRHHYVSIPNEIIPVSEEEGNQE